MESEKILNKVKDDYNKIADNFAQTRRNLSWPEIDYFMKYFKDGQSILDVGCGNGRLLNYLKNLSVKYQGVDNSESLIALAKKQYPNQANCFNLVDMQSLPFADEQFDIVICLASFHHLPSKQLRLNSLNEIKRVLKPNGLVLMTNWYVWQKTFIVNFFTNLAHKNHWNDFFIPWKLPNETINRYYHGFTNKELLSLFKQANFQVVEHKQFKNRNWLSVLKK